MLVPILQPVEWAISLVSLLQKEQIKLTPLPRKRLIPRNIPQVRRLVPYSQPSFEDSDDNTVAAMLRRPQQEIATQGAHDCIDELPALMRQLFEDPRFVSVNNNGEYVLFVQQSEENPPEFGGLDSDAEEYIGQASALAKITEQDGQLPSNMKWGKTRGLQRKVEKLQHLQTASAPALTLYIADTFPDHPMEKVSPILLESDPVTQIEIVVPKKEARAIILLSGAAEVQIQDEDSSSPDAPDLEDSASTSLVHLKENLEVFEVDGPCKIYLSHPRTFSSDALLAVGIPGVEDGRLQSSMDSLSRSLQSLGSIDVDNAIDQEEKEEPNRGLSFYSQINQSINGILPDIQQLSRDLPSSLNEQRGLWIKETSKKIPFETWRIRRKLRSLDEILTLDIDSIYHGRGYIPPSPSWDMITEERSLSTVKAADERLLRFEALHKSAKYLDSQIAAKRFRDRIRPLNQADKKIALKYSVTSRGKEPSALDKCKQRFYDLLKDRKHIIAKCPLCDLEFTSTPTYNDYREAYLCATDQLEEDALRSKVVFRCPRRHPKAYWDAIGGEQYQVLERYPITAVPSALVPSSRNMEGTENLLSLKGWLAFERRQQVIPAEYEYQISCKTCKHDFPFICSKEELRKVVCPNCKASVKEHISWSSIFSMVDFKEVSKQKFQEDGWWWKDRSKAFEEIFLKKSQWTTVYHQLQIQQERLRGHFLRTVDNRSSSERRTAWLKSRNEAMQIMRDLFHDCKTHIELKEFLSLTMKQKIAKNTGKILERSLMDRVTIGDELRIRMAVEKKKSK